VAVYERREGVIPQARVRRSDPPRWERPLPAGDRPVNRGMFYSLFARDRQRQGSPYPETRGTFRVPGHAPRRWQPRRVRTSPSKERAVLIPGGPGHRQDDGKAGHGAGLCRRPIPQRDNPLREGFFPGLTGQSEEGPSGPARTFDGRSPSPGAWPGRGLGWGRTVDCSPSNREASGGQKTKGWGTKGGT